MEIGIVPPGFAALDGNCVLASCLLPQQVQSHLPQGCHVDGRVVFANAAVIFIKSDIEDIMEAVLNAPMPPNDTKDFVGIAAETAEIIAHCGCLHFGSPMLDTPCGIAPSGSR